MKWKSYSVVQIKTHKVTTIDDLIRGIRISKIRMTPSGHQLIENERHSSWEGEAEVRFYKWKKDLYVGRILLCQLRALLLLQPQGGKGALLTGKGELNTFNIQMRSGVSWAIDVWYEDGWNITASDPNIGSSDDRFSTIAVAEVMMRLESIPGPRYEN